MLGRPARSRKAGNTSTAVKCTTIIPTDQTIQNLVHTELLRYWLYGMSHVHNKISERIVELEEQEHLTCSHAEVESEEGGTNKKMTYFVRHKD